MVTSTVSVDRGADGVFSAMEQQALLGFLGGYSGLTRDAYALDLHAVEEGLLDRSQRSRSDPRRRRPGWRP